MIVDPLFLDLITSLKAIGAPLSLASLIYLGLIIVFSFLSLAKGKFGVRARKVLSRLTRRQSDPSG